MSGLRVTGGYSVPEVEQGLFDDLIEARASELKAEGVGRLDAVNVICSEIVGYTLGERNRMTALRMAAPERVRTTPTRGALSGALEGAVGGGGLLGVLASAGLGALEGAANQRAEASRAAAERQQRVRAVQPFVVPLVKRVYKG